MNKIFIKSSSSFIKRISVIVVALSMLLSVVPNVIAADITSEIYDISENTITGVLQQTVLYDFLSELLISSSEQPFVARDGKRLYSGYIQTGDVLNIGDEEYTIEVENTALFDLTEKLEDAPDGVLYSKASGAAMDITSLEQYGVSDKKCENGTSEENAKYSITKGTDADSKPYIDISNDQNRTMFIFFNYANEDYGRSGKYLVTEIEVTPLDSSVHARFQSILKSTSGNLFELEHFNSASGNDLNGEFKIGHDAKYSIGGIKGKNPPSWVSSNTNMQARDWMPNQTFKVKLYKKIGAKKTGESLEIPQIYVDYAGETESFGPYSFPVTRAYDYINGVDIGVGSSQNGTEGRVRVSDLKVYISDSYPSAVDAVSIIDSGSYVVQGDEISGIYEDDNLTAGDFLDAVTVPDKAAKLVIDSDNNVVTEQSMLENGMVFQIESPNGENVKQYSINIGKRPKIEAKILPADSLEAGESLTADYSVIAPNNVSSVSYRWLAADSADGIYTAIEGETKNTLQLSAPLWKKYIKAEITPVGTNEISVLSECVGPVTDKRAEFAEGFNNATAFNIQSIIADAALSFSELADIKNSMNDYQMHLASLEMLKHIPYADFDAIVSEFERSAQSIIAAFSDDTAYSYESVASSEGSIINGHIDLTPDENVFKFGGKDFVVLDSNENEFYVITKDYYGTKAANSANEAKYNALDENSIAYFLNHSFITDGNAGSMLPNAVLNHINYHKVWISEPQSGIGGTKTVGGIGLMSAYEYKKYASRIGEDTIPSGAALYYLRTPNSFSAVSMLGLSMRELYGVSTQGSFVGSQANSPRHLRVAFYLDKSFFEKNKLVNAGSDVTERIAKMCSEQKLRGLYTDSEMDSMFVKPQITQASLNGRPIVGSTLTAAYLYECPFDESETEFQWMQSTEKNGAYTPITGATQSTIVLDSSLTGKYIKVQITPKSSLAINSQGEMFSSAATQGGVVALNDADKAAKVLNDLSENEISEYLQQNDTLFQSDKLTAELEDDVIGTAIGYLAQSEFTTIAEYDSDITTCITMAKLNKAPLENVETVITTSTSAVNKENYVLLTDKSSVNDYIKNTAFSNAEDFTEKVDSRVAVEYFNKATLANITDVLNRFSDKITKNISLLTQAQLANIGRELLKVNSYADMAAVNAKINAVYDDVASVKPTVNGAVSGSGNSSGGGGGSGIASGGKPSQSIPEDSFFGDLVGFEWAESAVNALAKKGIVNGIATGYFAPKGKLTREQFVKMIVTAFSLKSDDAVLPFKDVEDTQWYAEYIKSAYKNGIAFGVNETSFGVGVELTKEQMATFIYRALQKTGMSISEKSDMRLNDFEKVSDYAAEAVKALNAYGIVSGDENGCFNPTQTATRAMAAVVIYKTLENAEETK